MDTKRCPDCGETKPFTEFFREARRANGIGIYCKVCKTLRKNERAKVRRREGPEQTAIESAAKNRWRDRHPERYRAYTARLSAKLKADPLQPDRLRNWHYQRKFGITLAEYNARLDAQGGRCAICKKEPRLNSKTGRMVHLRVDHDHETGAVRGLLCITCNAGLGHLNDDPALLRIALSYLGAI